jgi:hypothetical protein
MKYDISAKRQIQEKIELLGEIEQFNIFKIIQKYDIPESKLTRLQNGVIVSTNLLSDECIDEISQYIEYCQTYTN